MLFTDKSGKKLKWAIWFASALLFGGVAQAEEGKAWEHSLEIYFLTANMQGKVGIGRIEGDEVDVNPRQIFDHLKMGFMARYEALHPSNWGLWLDYAFMDLNGDIKGERDGVLSWDMRLGILDAMAMYRQSLEKGHLDYYGGIRWWDMDIDAEFDPVLLPGSRERSTDSDWVESVIGVRWTRNLSPNWDLVLRGDLAGFGISSDMGGYLSGGFHYHFNDSWRLSLEYAGWWVDYEDGKKGHPDYFKYDVNLHGGRVGVVYRF